MDVRNAQVDPTIGNGRSCLSYFHVRKEAFRAGSAGGYVEFVGDFELKDGAALAP